MAPLGVVPKAVPQDTSVIPRTPGSHLGCHGHPRDTTATSAPPGHCGHPRLSPLCPVLARSRDSFLLGSSPPGAFMAPEGSQCPPEPPQGHGRKIIWRKKGENRRNPWHSHCPGGAPGHQEHPPCSQRGPWGGLSPLPGELGGGILGSQIPGGQQPSPACCPCPAEDGGQLPAGCQMLSGHKIPGP